MNEKSGEGSETTSSRKVNDIDTTGRTVAANVRRLRQEQRMTTAQLAERMDSIGRPIIANAITKIEQGKRRVSVDDLMALAAASGVTPNALLLPADLNARSRPTGLKGDVAANVLWAWACGERPLPDAVDPAPDVLAPEPGPWEMKGADPRIVRFNDQAAPHSMAPDAFFRHPGAIYRAGIAMMKMLDATPQLAETVLDRASSYGSTWSGIVKFIREHPDEMSSGTATAAEIETLMQQLDAGMDRN